MRRSAKLGRRGFLGLGVAIAGAAAVGHRGVQSAKKGLEWSTDPAFPGSICELLLRAPELSDGTRLKVSVCLHAPKGSSTRVCGEIVVQDGHGRLRVPLWYPYERRVPGRYLYRAEASGKEVSFETLRPTTYSVRSMVPFS